MRGPDAGSLTIRHAELRDLAALVEIDNYYIAETAITFHTEPFDLETRRPWFDGFAAEGRYQLLVALEGEHIVGYACSTRFRSKAAYDPSVETTVYLAPGTQQRGLGTQLYQALFAAIEHTGVHRLIAGITLPNPASLALHERMGFESIGVFHEIGFKQGRYWDVEWMERSLR